MINVCTIDDHDIVREGIKKILAQTNDIQVVKEAASPTEILNTTITQRIDVVILDLSFGDSYGDLFSIELIKNKLPRANILVFSMLDERVFGLEVLNYGVRGFVSKHEEAEELIKAVRLVKDGKIHVSKILSQELAQQFSSPSSGSLHSLSMREKEVLVLLGSGMQLKQIGEKLFISIKTVSTYKRRILDKLNLDNSSDIIKFCLKNKLITT